MDAGLVPVIEGSRGSGTTAAVKGDIIPSPDPNGIDVQNGVYPRAYQSGNIWGRVFLAQGTLSLDPPFLQRVEDHQIYAYTPHTMTHDHFQLPPSWKSLEI